MSEFLHFSEHTLQEVALVIMALVYLIRIRWFLNFAPTRERQGRTGNLQSTLAKSIVYSWANIAMPWAMESTRTKWLLYAQFVIFHLGVTAAISLSFVIPYGPAILQNAWVVLLFQLIIGSAFLVGLLRMIRRVSDPYMRAISSPDDYFSLVLLIVWFCFGVLAAPNDLTKGEWPLLGFFLLTAFFLLYVPFSKISHYLYYPFTRYYFGRSMGYRGVYPIKRQRGGGKNLINPRSAYE